MDAIVLCGGRGTRVREITKNEIPKILIPIHQRPFLDYLLVYLKKHYIQKVYFAAGFKGEKIEQYLRGSDYGMELKVEIESEPLLTGGGIISILNKYGDEVSDPFLVLNGDTLAHPGEVTSFSKMYKFFKQEYETKLQPVAKLKFPPLLFFTNYCYQHGEYDILNHNMYNLIDSIKEGKTETNWINCGWYIIRKAVFGPFLNAKSISLERGIFPIYFKHKNVAYPVPLDLDGFLDIGTMEAIETTKEIIQYKRWKPFLFR